MSSTNKQLGLIPLTILVMGGIVGSGIFSLPQNMAEGAGTGSILIAWAITLVGMLILTFCFQYIALRFSHISNGLYGYVKEGFGDYIGFNVAWGYWISAWMTCVSYLVILFSALGSFHYLSFFGEGTTLPAICCSIALLWIVHFFVLKGVYGAAILTCVVTIAKVVPIALFILCCFLAFKADIFKQDFWGKPELGSIFTQVKHTMLYTVWIYLGIESATIYASRAKKTIDVSKATLFGFMLTSLLLVCVSILSLGIIPQHELATLKNPSMAHVFERVVGSWGAVLINLGLILSVLGSLLAWLMLSSEMLYLAGRGSTHSAPKIFGKLNAAGTPVNSLWLTSACITLLLFMAYLHEAGYNTMIQLSTAMVLIPYALLTAFVLKLALIEKHPKLIMVGIAGTVYSLWLIYAGGLFYLLLSMSLYSLGLCFYIKATKERKVITFRYLHDKIYALAVVILGICALLYFIIGKYN